MGDSSLSQEDIDNLLSGGFNDSFDTPDSTDVASSQPSSGGGGDVFDDLDSLISGSDSSPASFSNPTAKTSSKQSTPTHSSIIPKEMQTYGNLQVLVGVVVNLNVELGKKEMLIKDILALGEGSIIELDKAAGDPVDLIANNRPLARGEVVVVDEQFGVRVTEMVDPYKFD